MHRVLEPLESFQLLVGDVLGQELVVVVVVAAHLAAALVDAVRDAAVADALAAAVGEPPIRRRTHRPAADLALLLGHALAQEHDGAVLRRGVGLRRRFLNRRRIDLLLLGRLDVDRVGVLLPPALKVFTVGQGLPKLRNRLFEIGYDGLLRRPGAEGRVGRGAETHTGATLHLEEVEAGEALLAAGAARRLDVTVTRSQQRALRHDRRANGLVAGFDSRHKDRRHDEDE